MPCLFVLNDTTSGFVDDDGVLPRLVQVEPL